MALLTLNNTTLWCDQLQATAALPPTEYFAALSKYGVWTNLTTD